MTSSSELSESFSYIEESVHKTYVTEVQYVYGWLEIYETRIERGSIDERRYFLTCPESEYAVWPILDR